MTERLKFPDEPIRVPSDTHLDGSMAFEDYDDDPDEERSCWTCGGDGYDECEEWDCMHPKGRGVTHIAPCPNCHGSGDAKDVW